MGCRHKFVFKKTDSFWSENGRYSRIYILIDYFFCEKCLDEQAKKKRFDCADHEIHSLPDWAKLITKKI
jgi:hypothetical protein